MENRPSKAHKNKTRYEPGVSDGSPIVRTLVAHQPYGDEDEDRYQIPIVKTGECDDSQISERGQQRKVPGKAFMERCRFRPSHEDTGQRRIHQGYQHDKRRGSPVNHRIVYRCRQRNRSMNA